MKCGAVSKVVFFAIGLYWLHLRLVFIELYLTFFLFKQSRTVEFRYWKARLNAVIFYQLELDYLTFLFRATPSGLVTRFLVAALHRCSDIYARRLFSFGWGLIEHHV